MYSYPSGRSLLLQPDQFIRRDKRPTHLSRVSLVIGNRRLARLDLAVLQCRSHHHVRIYSSQRHWSTTRDVILCSSDQISGTVRCSVGFGPGRRGRRDGSGDWSCGDLGGCRCSALFVLVVLNEGLEML